MRDRTNGSPLALIAALAVIAWATPAHATVMVEVPLEELVATADAIVVARVVQSEARLVLDPRRGAEPHTFSVLRVSEWLVGAGSDRLTVEELGGTIGDETYRIEGTPELAPGDEVVLFLEARPDGSLRTLDMAQGCFRIRRGVGQVPDHVVRDLDGIAFAHFVGAGMTVGHPAHEPAVELEAFLGTLRGLAQTLSSSTGSTTGPLGGAR